MRKLATGKIRGAVVIAAMLVAGGTAAYFKLRSVAGPSTASVSPLHPMAPKDTDGGKVQRPSLNELILPVAVVEKMGLKTVTAAAATHGISLPSFQGVLALDNDRLSRVHARFGGEVVEIGKSTDGSDPTLRVGERVERGDLLAVVWSTELGKKKSELVDSLTKLRAEEQLRDRLKKLFETGAVAGRSYRDAEKDVQIRLVEIASLERTLQTWRVSDVDLAGIRSEATRLANADEVAEAAMPAAEVRDWARVEVRAPMSGIILEKNVVVGDIVGTDTALFKIGNLSHLAVWAHVYEDDLPLLESLPQPIQWTVHLPSRPGTAFTGTLEKVSAVIDPTQHTALVTGRVENKFGDLRIGQFVTVTLELPPSQHELELPATAIVEDGRQSFVFVQPIHGEPRFSRRPIHVIRRSQNGIYIESAEKGVQQGDLVVTSGALMLQNAMDQIPVPKAAIADSVAGSTAELQASSVEYAKTTNSPIQHTD